MPSFSSPGYYVCFPSQISAFSYILLLAIDYTNPPHQVGTCHSHKSPPPRTSPQSKSVTTFRLYEPYADHPLLCLAASTLPPSISTEHKPSPEAQIRATASHRRPRLLIAAAPLGLKSAGSLMPFAVSIFTGLESPHTHHNQRVRYLRTKHDPSLRPMHEYGTWSMGVMLVQNGCYTHMAPCIGRHRMGLALAFAALVCLTTRRWEPRGLILQGFNSAWATCTHVH